MGEFGSIYIRCPQCETAVLRQIAEPRAAYGFKCIPCKIAFQSRIVTIRAKSSRGNRSRNTRDFTVRAIEQTGGESLIEFTKDGWDDIEMRSRDVVVLSYLKGRVALVQNLTVNVYFRVWKPSSRLSLLVLLCIFAFLVAVIFLSR